MQTIKSLSWVVGLSIVAGLFAAVPAKADRSFTDITGTNIWNNTAPRFDTNGKLDPELIGSITRFNRESEAAFRDCNAAIAAFTTASPRRFSRQPQTTAAVPQACRRLEALRQEAQSLETRLQQVQSLRANPAFRTW